jgi:hypothetical protein
MDAADCIETLIITSVSNNATNEKPTILIFKVSENLKLYVRLYFGPNYATSLGLEKALNALLTRSVMKQVQTSVPGLVVDLHRKITGKLNRQTSGSQIELSK